MVLWTYILVCLCDYVNKTSIEGFAQVGVLVIQTYREQTLTKDTVNVNGLTQRKDNTSLLLAVSYLLSCVFIFTVL